MIVNWNLDELVSYMQTWSAVNRFSTKERFNPLDLIMKDLESLWGKQDDQKTVKWDINIRVGIVHS